MDAPGEWYYNQVTGELYFGPNTCTTSGEAPSGVVAPLLDSIITVEDASDVSVVGFDFTETRATFLSQYEVPVSAELTNASLPSARHLTCI